MKHKQLTAQHIGYLVRQRYRSLIGGEITPIKLQKLVYLVFGYYGGATNEALFDDRIEAWKYGPVVPTLYHNGIVGPVLPKLEWEKNYQTQVIVVEKVIKQYGIRSDFELVGLTHGEGTPWKHVYLGGEMSIEIPKQIIIEYYRIIMRSLGFMADSGLLNDLAKT